MIDSHAHLFMLINKKNITLEKIINELQTQSVTSVLNISATAQEFSFAKSIEPQLKKNGITLYHSAGIHPHDATENQTPDLSWIYENKDILSAIGESGMDLHYEFSPEKEQVFLFRKMVELSIELNKPLIIHGRSAEEKIMDILKLYNIRDGNILFHCYTGTAETAQKIIEKGWYISLSGILTFPKSKELKNVLSITPLTRLLFETDSPFLAPVPYRGKVNTPAKVSSIYRYASEVLNMDIEELINTIDANFHTLFGTAEK